MLFFFLISLSSIFSKVKPKSVWKLPNRMSAPLLKPWASVGGALGPLLGGAGAQSAAPALSHRGAPGLTEAEDPRSLQV